MIREYAKSLMEKLEFPPKAQAELLVSLDVLLSTSDFLGVVNGYENEGFEFSEALEETKNIAERNNVHCYTANMLLIICMSKALKEKYKKQGIDDTIFYDTMCDFRYKLEECYLLYGIYGTFVPQWYGRFFEMRIFSLGRLQFEIKKTWFDCMVDGINISKGTNALSVHIPRTNTSLKHSFVLDSYNKATRFFDAMFDDKIIFVCDSWLLYPWNREVLKDESNLANFYDDFTIVDFGEYKDYNEVWRLFDCVYNGDVDALPNDTSLRRAYIDRIKNALPIGHGTGVIVYSKK